MPVVPSAPCLLVVKRRPMNRQRPHSPLLFPTWCVLPNSSMSARSQFSPEVRVRVRPGRRLEPYESSMSSPHRRACPPARCGSPSRRQRRRLNGARVKVSRRARLVAGVFSHRTLSAVARSTDSLALARTTSRGPRCPRSTSSSWMKCRWPTCRCSTPSSRPIERVIAIATSCSLVIRISWPRSTWGPCWRTWSMNRPTWSH